MITSLKKNPKLAWFDDQVIRPYVYVRSDSKEHDPGKMYDVDWFPHEPIYKNPLKMDDVSFANMILKLEHSAFEKSGMAMPRWVFYDCAVMPGFVAGFAHKTDKLTKSARAIYGANDKEEWTPISLFIIIPSMAPREWIAHNLCSINSLLPREERLYGLGFLSKAFGLWYANIPNCCGMTQWESPAIRLHSHYGPFEVLTAYTPVHSYAKTLTYRCQINPNYWPSFFSNEENEKFSDTYKVSGLTVSPKDEKSLIQFQQRIEAGEGPYFLSPDEIRSRSLSESLNIYVKA